MMVNREIRFEDILHPDEWISKKERFRCDACAKKFHNLFRRRHHCRLCGNLFCKECIIHKLVTVSPLQQIPVKLCATCAFEGPPVKKTLPVHQPNPTRCLDMDRFANDATGDDLLLFSPLVDDELPMTEQSFADSKRSRGYSIDELDFDESAEKPTATSPPRPANESERLEALRDFHILYTPPEESFNIWCELAATTMECPMAIVSFMDKDCQWFKAKLGITKNSFPRHLSFCMDVLTTGKSQCILNTAMDRRTCEHPLVDRSNGVRFYAAAPLMTNSGFVIGTLAVFDVQPRRSCQGLPKLESLAQSIMKDMEERRIYDAKYRHRRKRLAASFDDRALLKTSEPPVKASLTPNFGPTSTPSQLVPPLDLVPPSEFVDTAFPPDSAPSKGKMQDMLLDLLCKTTETQQHLASQQGSMFITLGQHTEQIDRLAEAVAQCIAMQVNSLTRAFVSLARRWVVLGVCISRVPAGAQNALDKDGIVTHVMDAKSPFGRKSPTSKIDFSHAPTLAISQIIHPDDWIDHSHRRKCYVCQKVFNKLLRRKHNCRMCGEVICSKCRVPQRLVLARNEQPTVAQVCLVCVQKIPTLHATQEQRQHGLERRGSGHTANSDHEPTHSSSFFVFQDDQQSVVSQSNASVYSTDIVEPEPEVVYPCSYRLDYSWDYPWPKPPPVPKPVEKQTMDMLNMLDILDTPKEESFDRIASSARKSVSNTCKVACVSFMDFRSQRQWFKAHSGIAQDEIPISASFCSHTMYLLDVTVILDTHKDERFCNNPLVTSESTRFRFYAGAPVIVENVCIGTVFVFDTEPRQSLKDVDSLKLTKLAELTAQLLLERKMLPAHCSIKGGSRSMSRSSSAPSLDQMYMDRQDENTIENATLSRNRSMEPKTPAISTPPVAPPTITPSSTPSSTSSSTTKSMIIPDQDISSPTMESMLMSLLSKTTETQQQIASQQGTLYVKINEQHDQINKLAQAVARMEAKLSSDNQPDDKE